MNKDIQTILDAIGRVESNLSELRTKNETVFLELDQLLGLRGDLVEKLKPLARSENLKFANEFVSIDTTRKFKTTYSVDALKRLELNVRHPELITEVVNAEAFKTLEKNGVLDPKAVNAVVSKEPMTAAVEVKFLKNK